MALRFPSTVIRAGRLELTWIERDTGAVRGMEYRSYEEKTVLFRTGFR